MPMGELGYPKKGKVKKSFGKKMKKRKKGRMVESGGKIAGMMMGAYKKRT